MHKPHKTLAHSELAPTILEPSAASRGNPLQFHNISLQINGFELIHNISCTLQATGKTVVLGPNGAGKSLFLRLMAGLLEPTSGSITGGSHDRASPLATNDQLNAGQPCSPPCVALVFQKAVMLRRSVFDNLAFVLHQRKIAKTDRKAIIDNSLRLARLETKARVPARRLSGGEQQRLALARALIQDPVALLLDEPTASLDPHSTAIVEGMVEDADNGGTKIVFVTHDIKQAKRMADDILFIQDGRVQVHKEARAFFEEPGSREAQAYLDGRMPN